MTERPDLRELIGEDVSPEELERLQRAHELLLQAGPPPELSPSLAGAPSPGEVPAKEDLSWLPPRRAGRILTLAAGFAALALALGYLVGRGHGGFDTDFTIAMHGTGSARQAQAVIKVAKLDEAGNWPLELEVSGLKELPPGGYYELWLTKGKHRAASCGTFRVHEGDTMVRLNAPYNFKRFKPIGWIVTAKLPGKAPSKTPLLTT